MSSILYTVELNDRSASARPSGVEMRSGQFVEQLPLFDDVWAAAEHVRNLCQAVWAEYDVQGSRFDLIPRIGQIVEDMGADDPRPTSSWRWDIREYSW